MNTDITKQMEMVLYRTEDDNVTVSALIKDETIWITQKAMAELFGVQTPAISKHLKNIFEQGELREEVVVSKMEIPTPHGAILGKTQLSPTHYYNLDAIISVGYRVNSIQATKFRIWATGILKEYTDEFYQERRAVYEHWNSSQCRISHATGRGKGIKTGKNCIMVYYSAGYTSAGKREA